jgi:hypothetical protein
MAIINRPRSKEMQTATIMTRKSIAPKPWYNRSDRWSSIFREGVMAGILSGAVVALWYLLCDSIAGRPFHTPALLGAIFFDGLRGHDVGAATLAPVLSFIALHFAAFIAFGLASALVIAAAEREPLLVLGALMVYACYEVCFLAFVSVLDASALGTIGWWKIAAANAITLATVFAYFQYRHPQILPRFSEQWVKFDKEPTASPSILATRVVSISPISGDRA